MNELARALARRIRVAGPVNIAAYMAEALGNPEHGYYTTRDPLGARGDFITAPEISQIFGELIGLWCADTWERMGRPDPVILAEFGPGRGTLMEDALRALRVAPDFRRAMRLHLVETSPVLRAAQKAALGEASPSWHDAAAGLPDGPLIAIANEFLDALPIRQFVKSEKGWHERFVGLSADEDHLVFVLEPNVSMGAEVLIPRSLRAAPAGSLCEVSVAAASLAHLLGARLAAQAGAALFVDYGYFPSACGETLQALRRHQRHDVLADPGDADLTAHVDFAAFAAAANEAGAATWGPVSQGAFLTSLGLAPRAAKLLTKATPAQAAAIDSACRRLIDPAGMGTLFKVLALGNPALSAPAGFAGDELH